MSNIFKIQIQQTWLLFMILCFSILSRCWLSSEFQYMHLVNYITVGLLCLVVLYNSCMLALVVFKLWRIRGGRGGYESSSNWKKMTKEKGTRLWKDCATVLGLSCVLGLPWGLASVTYATLAGIYMFTTLTSLQGQFSWPQNCMH